MWSTHFFAVETGTYGYIPVSKCPTLAYSDFSLKIGCFRVLKFQENQARKSSGRSFHSVMTVVA